MDEYRSTATRRLITHHTMCFSVRVRGVRDSVVVVVVVVVVEVSQTGGKKFVHTSCMS